MFYCGLLIISVIVLFVAYLAFNGNSSRASNVVAIADSAITDCVTQTDIVLTTVLNASSAIDTTISTTADILDPIV